MLQKSKNGQNVLFSYSFKPLGPQLIPRFCKIPIFTNFLHDSSDILFKKDWWIITKFGKIIGDTYGDVIEGFILLQHLDTKQGGLKTQRMVILCLFLSAFSSFASSHTFISYLILCRYWKIIHLYNLNVNFQHFFKA